MKTFENFIHNKYGYCYYSINKNSALIFNLYILKKYRRKGHARKLLNAVIREIREMGYDDKIQIEAIPREKSISHKNIISFYKGMGLEIYENII